MFKIYDRKGDTCTWIASGSHFKRIYRLYTTLIQSCIWPYYNKLLKVMKWMKWLISIRETHLHFFLKILLYNYKKIALHTGLQIWQCKMIHRSAMWDFSRDFVFFNFQLSVIFDYIQFTDTSVAIKESNSCSGINELVQYILQTTVY